MRELKCPHCKKVFTVDETDYAAILNQVKNAELNAEIERRMAEIEARKKTELDLAMTNARKEFSDSINAKENELNNKIAEIERLKLEMKSQATEINSRKNSEIEALKQEIKTIGLEKETEHGKVIAERDRKIAELESEIRNNKTVTDLAVMNATEVLKNDIQGKNLKITQLQAEKELIVQKSHQDIEELKKDRDEKIQEVREDMQKQIEYYKDFKIKMSTKAIGESLEKHCSDEFNANLRSFLPNAYFEKDNKPVEGTKGDFIFKDYIDGVEYISIMFEMKNEADDTATKHKNDDFLNKLDADRKKKGCEYAVLVSMLEADSDLYNVGIVDKSYMYPKMYVIRPQFFIPIISLLVQTSRSAYECKRDLAIEKQKNIDVTSFEEKVNSVREKIEKHYTQSTANTDSALSEIDKIINRLEALKTDIKNADKYLRYIANDFGDLTVRKLTYRNPTMKKMFEEASKVLDGNTLEVKDDNLLAENNNNEQ